MTHEPECPSIFKTQADASETECLCHKLAQAIKTKGDKLTLSEFLLVLHHGNQIKASSALAIIDQIHASINDPNRKTTIGGDQQ